MVLYVLDALADCARRARGRRRRPRRRAGHQEAAGGGPARPAIDFVEQHVQRGTGDAVSVGLTALRRRRPRRRRRRRHRAARRHAAAAARPPSPRSSTQHRRDRRRVPRCSPPRVDDPTGYGRVVRGKRRPGARIVEQRDATDDERAIDEINTSIYCFRRSVLGPGAAPPQPRQRPGRVLPHRRRRGAARRRATRSAPSWPTTRPRPRASTTGCSWPWPRPSCAAAPTTRWLRSGRHDGRPAPDLHRRHRAAGAATSRCSRARSCRAAPSIGDGAEIGPDTRLVDCVVGRGRRRRAHRRPRRRDRRRRPRRPVRRPARRARQSPPAAATGPFYTADRRRAEADRGARHMELVTKKRLLARTRAARTRRWPRRSPTTSASSSASRTCVEFANGEIRTAASASRSAAPTCSSSRPTAASTAVGQRLDHGAADHDRRRQAGVGQAHHRRLPLLRLRPPGPQGRGPRADHRQARRRHVQGRRRQADGLGRPALRPDPGLLRRPGRPPHRHAGAESTTCASTRERPRHRVARRRPDEGGRALRPAPRAPTWPSSTSAGRRAAPTRSRPAT